MLRALALALLTTPLLSTMPALAQDMTPPQAEVEEPMTLSRMAAILTAING